MFFIAEFERAAKIRKIAVLPFLNISSSSTVSDQKVPEKAVEINRNQ